MTSIPHKKGHGESVAIVIFFKLVNDVVGK